MLIKDSVFAPCMIFMRHMKALYQINNAIPKALHGFLPWDVCRSIDQWYASDLRAGEFDRAMEISPVYHLDSERHALVFFRSNLVRAAETIFQSLKLARQRGFTVEKPVEVFPFLKTPVEPMPRWIADRLGGNLVYNLGCLDLRQIGRMTMELVYLPEGDILFGDHPWIVPELLNLIPLSVLRLWEEIQNYNATHLHSETWGLNWFHHGAAVRRICKKHHANHPDEVPILWDADDMYRVFFRKFLLDISQMPPWQDAYYSRTGKHLLALAGGHENFTFRFLADHFGVPGIDYGEQIHFLLRVRKSDRVEYLTRFRGQEKQVYVPEPLTKDEKHLLWKARQLH